MYVGSMYFYQSDHVSYRLEADGEIVSDESAVHFETFASEGEESRFFALNALGAEECEPQQLYDYLIRAYFADHVIRML